MTFLKPMFCNHFSSSPLPQPTSRIGECWVRRVLVGKLVKRDAGKFCGFTIFLCIFSCVFIVSVSAVFFSWFLRGVLLFGWLIAWYVLG